jgi:hypothetical protein
MTLSDAFASYASNLHTAALRPHFAWRVSTPANSNSAHLPSLRAGADCLSPVGLTTSQVQA